MLPFQVLACMGLWLVSAEAVATEPCVVSRRLPPFALAYGVTRERKVDTSASASRAAAGVCHMGRLPRVKNGAATVEPGLNLSTQMCTRNTTTLTCAMLAQNRSDPAASVQHVRHFETDQPRTGTRRLRQAHTRRRPCASCRSQQLENVLTRLLRTKKMQGKAQLSFGVPWRLSTARVVAAHLHRQLCGANETCQPLQRALSAGDECAEGECLQQQSFLATMLNKTTGPNRASHALLASATDALWDRSWVWCPYAASASDGYALCSGSIPKKTWLDPTERARACAAEIKDPTTTSPTVNFCLLNKKTMELCQKMDKWRRDTVHILCQASGNCDSTDFFYSPTTFNLREQEFVFDSVVRFYREDVGRECATPENWQMQSNDRLLKDCASVRMQPFLVIAESLRDSKRIILLIGYHGVRVLFWGIQLLVSSTMDAAANFADAASYSLEHITARLLLEVRALMQQIGNFVEQMRDTLIELALSRGAGKEVKEIILFLCEVVRVFRMLWLSVGCPFINNVLTLAGIILDFLSFLERIPLGIGDLFSFIGEIEKIVRAIQEMLNDCEDQGEFSCNLDAKQGETNEETGTLPLPTRCWSSYLTFFGDSEQLSCSAADTCKDSRVASFAQTRVCGACPAQTNAVVLKSACDQLTGFCTCGVPELRSTFCFSNEDCLEPGSEATCLLINDELQTSRSAVACDDCQHDRMCLHSSQAGMGVCACGARQRHFHVCSAQEHRVGDPLSLRLDNLCLLTATTGIVEFATSSVIACQELDASTSSCALVVDRQTYMARGSSRGRRRLLGIDATYESMDSVCRDALQVPALVHTRARCQQDFDSSKQTLALLGLASTLPPCALCSYTDVMEAARVHPIAFLHILSSPRLLWSVMRRHGPGKQAADILAVLHRQFADISRASNNTQIVFVDSREGSVFVTVDDSVLPPLVARALEHWILETLQTRRQTLGNSNASAWNNSAPNNATEHLPGRQLLFLQEVVLAIEKGVREGWVTAGRLNDAFSQSVSQILSYDYAPQAVTGNNAWPPIGAAAPESCNELQTFLLLLIDITEGVTDGWNTLTDKRGQLQNKPAETLRDAWPQLLRPAGNDAIPDLVFDITASSVGDDVIAQWSAEATNATLHALDVHPRVFYDVLFSLASAANASFSCPYRAVQSCSAWRVRLWQAIVIVGLYFSAVSVFNAAFGLSFLSMLLFPLFGVVIMQLCYGYTWTCVPMVPVCAWQDFTESVHVFLPLSLEIPDELKKLDARCFVLGSLQRYPPPDCLKSCRDAPFTYTSWTSVVAWWVADLGAADFVSSNSHSVPLINHAAFNQEISIRTRTLRRTSPDSVRSHRICALLSLHLLIPYFLVLLLVLAFLGNIVSALTSQLYCFFLLICTLFAAVSVRASHKDSDDDEQQQ